MDAIFIPQLIQAPERTEEIHVDEFLPGLDTLTPVRGTMRVRHCGNYIEVSAQAESIITCTCCRCLKQYNHRLVVNTDEIIWLDEAANQFDDLPLEREVAVEDLVESLLPQGYFYPSEWLYEQMCLEIPPRQLCEQSCAGIKSTATISENPLVVDKRWASLEALKKQLPN